MDSSPYSLQDTRTFILFFRGVKLGLFCASKTRFPGFRAFCCLNLWPLQLIESGTELHSVHHNLKLWLFRAISISQALCESYPALESSLRPQLLVDTYNASRIIESVEDVFARFLFAEQFQGDKAPAYFHSTVKSIGKLCDKIHLDTLRGNLNAAMYGFYTEDLKMTGNTLRWIQGNLKMFYKSLKYIKEIAGPYNVLCPEHLPSQPSLKIAALLYLNNDFAKLEEMLKVLQFEQPDSSSPSSSNAATSAPREERKKAKKTPPALTVKKVLLSPKQSRNCPRTEGRRGTFLTCEKCQQDKYPDVNFYCSKSCMYAWWKQEHMAEHLEFDLGLADFSHLNQDK